MQAVVRAAYEYIYILTNEYTVCAVLFLILNYYGVEKINGRLHSYANNYM